MRLQYQVMESRAVSEREIIGESESEITPDIIDSESDKSEEQGHSTLLSGDKTRAVASLRAPRERFGRCPEMV